MCHISITALQRAVQLSSVGALPSLARRFEIISFATIALTRDPVAPGMFSHFAYKALNKNEFSYKALNNKEHMHRVS